MYESFFLFSFFAYKTHTHKEKQKKEPCVDVGDQL